MGCMARGNIGLYEEVSTACFAMQNDTHMMLAKCSMLRRKAMVPLSCTYFYEGFPRDPCYGPLTLFYGPYFAHVT